MISERVQTKLGDIVTLKRGYDLPASDRHEGDYPIVSSSGISGSHNEAKAKAPGVVTGRYGTIGELFFIESDYWPLNTALYVSDFKGNIPRYVYYFLHSVDFGQFSDKSSVPGVNRNHLHTIEVSFERNLDVQRAVAKILGDLDNAISLLRKSNHTLEVIAHTLFEAWFTDFLPVRAKAAGAVSFRGMPQVLFDKLPNVLEPSEIGEIPAGWQLRNLAYVLNHPRRSADPKDVSASTPYIGLEHMPRGSISLGEWGIAGAVTSNKHFFKKGEILFGKLRPNFHKVGVACVDGVCSTDIVVLSPKQPEYFGYSICCVSSEKFVAYNVSASSGTKMPRTSFDIMSRFRIALPKLDKEILEAFDQAIRPLISKLERNVFQIRKLTELRDTLVPKLISGETGIPDLAALGLAEDRNDG
jgi:type I restriction enzyme S subunit